MAKRMSERETAQYKRAGELLVQLDTARYDLEEMGAELFCLDGEPRHQVDEAIDLVRQARQRLIAIRAKVSGVKL